MKTESMSATGKSFRGNFFADTAFDSLMRERILNVLLICSKYDAFLLEEDGRVEEQIFNEYVALNLRYPPKFIHVSTADEALSAIKIHDIHLVITMINIKGLDPFGLASDIKGRHPAIPIVVLTPFSREVFIKLNQQDLSAIDHVFAWLGNAQILLAIIKLIEDSMNASHDVSTVGVQVILLVEDSIRFYSAYLPNLYRIIFTQSKTFMTEGLNEHQKMLRMRGRPKILLAKNMEQAMELYKQYKDNMIGVISDVRFPQQGVANSQAGFMLVRRIREHNPHMPIVIQSSEAENEQVARTMNVGFIHKHSLALEQELQEYIENHFSFGDFVFREPSTGRELFRAHDLKSFQELLFGVPDQSLEYHIRQNHIYRWCNARALFPIAELFKRVGPDEFGNPDELRRFLFDAIDRYRATKGRGVITSFARDNYDVHQVFSRIGDGSLGGKGRGLAFIDSIIKRHKLMHAFQGVTISIPHTVVICADVFDEFMETNNLHSVAFSDASNELILDHFLRGSLPTRIHQDLLSFLAVVRNPIAVRSSSLLEDTLFQPFAGIYSTYMLPFVKDSPKAMLDMVSSAIKGVFASVYYRESKAYMMATHNTIADEHMAVQLQEIIGSAHGNRFYPNISGVARSVNFYPIDPEQPGDGVATVALGLGKHVVEGRPSLRFCPQYPKKVFQLTSPEIALKDTQKTFFALSLNPQSFEPSTNDAINFLSLDIAEAYADGTLCPLASTYDFNSQQVRDGYSGEGLPIISFAGILKHKQFPIADILKTMLEIGQREMNNPVEIEFAVNLSPQWGQLPLFAMLQIRPIVQSRELVEVKIRSAARSNPIIYTPSALGNGRMDNLFDIVYIKPEQFKPSLNPNIAKEIEVINSKLAAENRNYILIGPGRWGSSDPWLGIPVNWSQISAARVIVEAGQKNYKVDPSQGTHFFQNLNAFGVGYLTVNPHLNQGTIDYEFMDKQVPLHESQTVRHIQFASPLSVLINGRTREGVILKPRRR